MHAFEEEGFGNGRDRDEGGRVCKTFGIVYGAENGYGVGGRSKCFHAFVGLLAVVEGWCHTVQAQVGVCYEGGRGPFAGFDGVVGFNVSIDCEMLNECSVGGA